MQHIGAYMDACHMHISPTAAQAQCVQAARSGTIVIGLFGEEAPGTAAMFKDLFAGALDCPCQEIEIDAVLVKEQLQVRACAHTSPPNLTATATQQATAQAPPKSKSWC